MNNFRSSEWLLDNLDNPQLSLMDATWLLNEPERAYHDYLSAHIPGAVFLDLDSLADPRTNLPHMLPPQELFDMHMRQLGLTNDSCIVLYDQLGLFSAPRAWWMFRVFNIQNVFILTGGLSAWRQKNYPLEQGLVHKKPSHFSSHSINHLLYADIKDVDRARREGSAQIIDARSPERFAGQVPEPRPQTRSGHIPTSVNLHYMKLIHNGSLRPSTELVTLFEGIGIDLTRPIITSCGSGITAAILSLALDEIGVTSALYDGSWAEWGALTTADCGFTAEKS